MTYKFRGDAYRAVQEAEQAGLAPDSTITVASPPGVYRTTLRDLKRMLHADRKERQRRRNARA